MLGHITMFDTIDRLGVNTLRTLSMDAIQKQILDILVYGLRQWLITMDKTPKSEPNNF